VLRLTTGAAPVGSTSSSRARYSISLDLAIDLLFVRSVADGLMRPTSQTLRHDDPTHRQHALRDAAKLHGFPPLDVPHLDATT
jgi:hypothetical protein